MSRTPKRTKPTMLDGDQLHLTPPSRIIKLKTHDFEKLPVNGSPNALSPSETRRGRPRAEVLNSLILQGSTSPSSIKCTYCNRVFPREKSLQAHLRTHTGEKPYVCDFPKCTRRFAQSGQLKTHQRLHTGEKPFVCSVLNCDRKFTHANRHCPEHPDVQLKRFASATAPSIEKFNDEEHSHAVQEWLDSVKRKDRRFGVHSINTTPKKHPRSLNNGWGHHFEQNENINYLNIQRPKILKMSNYNTSPKMATCTSDSDSSPSMSDLAARALMELHDCCLHKNDHTQDDLSISDTELYPSDSQTDDANDLMTDSQTDSGPDSLTEVGSELMSESNSIKSSPETNEIPKKRWLQQWDSTQDLAQPINWSEETPNIVETENQKRPTVLVRIENGQEKEVSKSDMQVAMALVELGNSKPSLYNY